MTKFDKWLDNQNEATKVYFKNRMREDDQLVWLGMMIGFPIGILFTILILL